MGHGGPRAPRVRSALQPPCQPPSLASPLLPHIPCQGAAAHHPTGGGEEHAGSSGAGASETACAAQGAVGARGSFGDLGEGTFSGTSASRDGRRCPAALQRAGCPRRFSSPILKTGALSTKRGGEHSLAPGAVPSRAEKGEDPEGPLFTLRPGWESHVEPQGFIWQPRLEFPHTGW